VQPEHKLQKHTNLLLLTDGEVQHSY